MPFKDETLKRAYSYLMVEGTAEARKKHHVVKTQAMHMAATLIQYGGIATSDEDRVKGCHVNHRLQELARMVLLAVQEDV